MLPLILLGAAYLISRTTKSVEEYHLGGDMSKHLAPNGKPSNLTHEQWHLVRTPEFKAWFGDWENNPANASKVVDENGEPLMVFHGTKESFNEFKKESQNAATGFGDFGAGFYFTSSYDTAKYYTLKFEKRVIFSVFLKILNPFVIELNWERFSENTIENYKKLKGLFDWQKLAIKNVLSDKDDYRPSKTITKEIGDYNFQDILSVNGFDGVFVNRYNIYEFEDANHRNQILPLNEIVAFEPNQIKLADGTNTTFDGSNPDIRYEGGGESDTITIDGKESTIEDFIKIYQAEISRNYFNLNPKKIEYNGNDRQIKEAIEDYNKEINPYSINGKLKDNYMKAIVIDAFYKTSFRKFGDAYRKNINYYFSAENNLRDLRKGYTWKDKASYIVGDSYYNDEKGFRSFAKDLGIVIPPNKTKFEGGGVFDENREQKAKMYFYSVDLFWSTTIVPLFISINEQELVYQSFTFFEIEKIETYIFLFKIKNAKYDGLDLENVIKNLKLRKLYVENKILEEKNHLEWWTNHKYKSASSKKKYGIEHRKKIKFLQSVINDIDNSITLANKLKTES
jgi:hypothetical protein